MDDKDDEKSAHDEHLKVGRGGPRDLDDEIKTRKCDDTLLDAVPDSPPPPSERSPPGPGPVRSDSVADAEMERLSTLVTLDHREWTKEDPHPTATHGAPEPWDRGPVESRKDG